MIKIIFSKDFAVLINRIHLLFEVRLFFFFAIRFCFLTILAISYVFSKHPQLFFEFTFFFLIILLTFSFFQPIFTIFILEVSFSYLNHLIIFAFLALLTFIFISQTYRLLTLPQKSKFLRVRYKNNIYQLCRLQYLIHFFRGYFIDFWINDNYKGGFK